jgi:hypothetical protein
MSADNDRQQAKMKEFMSLLPLTIEIAGLHPVESGRMPTEGQMEARVMAIKQAYKFARQLVIDVSRGEA